MAHWRHINLAAKTPVDHELSHGESISKCVDVSASALQDRAQLVWLRWSVMTDMATFPAVLRSLSELARRGRAVACAALVALSQPP